MEGSQWGTTHPAPVGDLGSFLYISLPVHLFPFISQLQWTFQNRRHQSNQTIDDTMPDSRSRVTKRVQYSCENCRWVVSQQPKMGEGNSGPKTDIEIEERRLAVREKDRHALLVLDSIKVVATMMQQSQHVRQDNNPAALW
jgi:hypothetical protein